ncbi:MAG TPA: DNA recombination protein RmuC [Stellaceae bacterium]|nr:DNA recombination protein RmuC [Stellaceae bacterium]
MEIIVAALLAVVAALALGFVLKSGETQRRIAAETRLAEAEKRVAELTASGDSAAAARLTAETELAAARQRVADGEQRVAEFERVKAAHLAAETELATARERIANGETRIAEYEHLKEESLQAARAAVLTTAQEVSSKLLEDHKRENAEAKEEATKRVATYSETVMKQMETLLGTISAIDGRVQQHNKVLDTVWRSLTNPSGAGQLAEVGLANTLKAFGLEQGRDFQLQFSTQDEEGRRLRPDAVVFLPSNGVMVIDSKASKFLLEIASAEGTEREAEAYRSLARTMNMHLKALGEKDYASAIRSAWRESGREHEVARIVSVMYLPNEAALDKLTHADAEFLHSARSRGIYLAGPTTLHCLISLASAEINLERQVENQQRIVAAAEALIDGLSGALVHVANVGKNLSSAAEAFSKFAGSTNRFVLGRARKLAAMGLEPGKRLPPNLPVFQVTQLNQVIEGQATEDPELPITQRRPRLISESE